MPITDLKLEYQLCAESGRGIPVIIVAAGTSSRMQGIDKQQMLLEGIPVIVRTMRCFERSPKISRIILVAKNEAIPDIQLLADKYMICKLSDIVAGGNDRQSSVMCGIERLTAEEEAVLIHDGARPFIDERMVSDTAEALNDFDAAVCAVKINDTVKLSEDGSTIRSSVDRSNLYSAQTPQGIRVSAYKDALSKLPDDTIFTDDASVIEAVGGRVKLVQGNRINIKITTPEDIAIAQAFVKEFG